MNSEIVPFGKYKDQPVELMLADQNYLEWITGQPGIMTMLQGKYPALFNIITIGAPQTSDTPEHNKLQAMFLERTFQESFIHARLGKRVETIGEELADKFHSKIDNHMAETRRFVAGKVLESAKSVSDVRLIITETKGPGPEEQYKKAVKEHQMNPKPYLAPGSFEQWLEGHSARVKQYESRETEAARTLQAHKEMLSQLLGMHINPGSPSSPKILIEFECGYDIKMTARWEIEATIPAHEFEYDHKRAWDRLPKSWKMVAEKKARREEFAIEIKPLMGDDFPSVLRQMKRNGADTLLLGAFNAAGCTLDQVRAIFGDKKIVTLQQIQRET
jgi:hypothetical protein